jgi:hypothetical protein
MICEYFFALNYVILKTIIIMQQNNHLNLDLFIFFYSTVTLSIVGGKFHSQLRCKKHL